MGVRLRLDSADGDQGFPGRLAVGVDYLLDRAGRLRIDLAATNLEPAGGRPTVVNLTNHAYFNLGGESSGSVEDHLLTIPATRFTPLRPDLTPTGELAPVAGTPLDFRTATPIGCHLHDDHEQLRLTAGFDHNWVLDPASPVLASDPALRLALQAAHPGTGRVLRIWSDQPGVQVFVANTFDGTMIGKSGRGYRRWAGFTAETQHFPDSPNHPAFPSTVLAAGQTLTTSTVIELTMA